MWSLHKGLEPGCMRFNVKRDDIASAKVFWVQILIWDIGVSLN